MTTSSASPLGFRLIVGAFFLLGLGLLVGALVDAGSTLRLLHTSWVADGEIIWMDRVHRVHRTGYVYMPVFRFVMENGQTFTLRSNKGSNPPAFKVGDSVKVYYKPDHPELAVMNTFEQLWASDVGLACVGLVVMGLGALMLRGRGMAKQKYAVVINEAPKTPGQA